MRSVIPISKSLSNTYVQGTMIVQRRVRKQFLSLKSVTESRALLLRENIVKDQIFVLNGSQCEIYFQSFRENFLSKFCESLKLAYPLADCTTV